MAKNITKFFFEDFTVGQKFEGKGITLTEASIIEFALSYDPQPVSYTHLTLPTKA